MNTLKIIIRKQWFDEIASGNKSIEYREVKPFWTSRLYDPQGNPKMYNSILFIAGYQSNAPHMLTEYLGVQKKGDTYHIFIGKILSEEEANTTGSKKAASHSEDVQEKSFNEEKEDGGHGEEKPILLRAIEYILSSPSEIKKGVSKLKEKQKKEICTHSA